MGKKLTRYVVTGNVTANSVSLKGVVVMALGPCTWDGRTPRGGKNPVKIPSTQLTHLKFKFEDMKQAKSMGIPPDLAFLCFKKDLVGKFLTKKTKESEQDD